ncbi:relaxase/mobilization nuclease domain-containing protein [Chryseobacterium artocarpi]|uniref:relaxase/mobilization nuclease domain-containing protein n=1 Tax=Chryseobacterium artocarpi TaxID=1414727 RepID=UPI003F34D9E6
MIAKAKSVKGSLAGAMYKEREDKQHEFICQNNMIGENARERWEEMRDIANLNSRTENKYIENVISPPREIGEKLTKEDWEKIAKDYAEKMNFGENQWYAVKHNNTDEPHLHIIVNRIDFSAKNTINSQYIGEKSGKTAETMSRERGWKTAQEFAKEKKEKIKVSLQNSVGSSRSWGEVADKMKSQGYHLELSYKEGNKLNGARVIPLQEFKNKEDMSRREQLAKKGYKLSEIDRKIKIGDLDKKIKENELKQEKTQNYGRRR